MAADRNFRVLLATDGSAHAKAALATAVRFPWPERTNVRGFTARHLRTDYRRSILLATADSAGADLLVVGARGVSGVRHLLLGSVAEGVLNRCPVPVLVVR